MRIQITGSDKDFYMSDELYEKLELMKERITNLDFDNLLILDGSEGLGKSTLAVQICYAMGQLCKRKFDVSQIFFDLDKLLRFASQTKEQIILWDESALGGMSTDQHNTSQKKLIKLLITARKKNHFFLFIIPKFFRLKENIVDRSIGLIRAYSRDGTTRGRFAYFLNDSKNDLYQEWRRTRYCPYERYYDFADTFPKTFGELIDADAYDKMKDEAIASIVQDEKQIKNESEAKLNEQTRKLVLSDLPQTKIAEILGVSTRTVRNLKQKAKNEELMKENRKGREAQYTIIGESNEGIDEDEVLVDEVKP